MQRESDAVRCQECSAEGRWQAKEHHEFLRAMIRHGKDWKIVEKEVQTRTGSQVRSHAQKFFIKLVKFNKERKKGKNWDLVRPQEIEQEIIDLFTPADITPLTPKEIVSLLTTDWAQVSESYSRKRQMAIQKKAARKQKPKPKESSSEEEPEEVINQMTGMMRELNESNDESYFVRIIKSNKEHFINGNDFTSLFQFGHHHSHLQEDSQTHHNRDNPDKPETAHPGPRDRALSFSLPDEPNPNRLKETLDSLHKAMGYEG